MPPSSTPPEFFVDRSLGRRVVPETIRGLGYVVHTMVSVFGDRELFVADVEWLEHAGRAGWVVLTKDENIRRAADELDMVNRFRVRVFALKKKRLRGREQALRFTNNMERIVRCCDREDGPYIYGVYEDRIRRLWPSSE